MEYEIIKKLGIIEGDPEGYRLEANIISWDGRAPKVDIRKWQPTNKPAGGICLSESGMEKLREILKDVTL